MTDNTIAQWLEANKGIITHFRPRGWCGQAFLYAYNRNEKIPYIDGQPAIYDTPENIGLIRQILGEGFVGDPFAPMSSGKY